MQAFFANAYTQLHSQNEEVFITASFRGDVKLLVPGRWLILATCAIPASLLATFGKNICKKNHIIIKYYNYLNTTCIEEQDKSGSAVGV